jgi:hypothetical protein
MCAGKDWFSAFLTRNGDIAVRKPEGLWRAIAQGLNYKALDDYFDLYRNLCTELNICDKPHVIFNVDETGFPLNNVPPKIVIAKGVRDVIKFTSAERGENVTVVVQVVHLFLLFYFQGDSFQGSIQAGFTRRIGCSNTQFGLYQ